MNQSPPLRPPVSIRRAITAALVTILVWAAAFPAIALGVRLIDPIPLAAARFAVAAIVMGAWLALSDLRLPSRRDVPRIFVCGCLGIALYNILLNVGERTVSPAAASFIVATQPVFAAFTCWLVDRERIGALAAAGIALSLTGVAVIALQKSSSLAIEPGAAMVLGSAACSGAYFVLQRPLVLRYGSFPSAAWTIIAGALLLSPWLPRGFEQATASEAAAAVVLFLALGAGVLGYACWMTALAGLGAARASSFLFLMAPLTMILSIPMMGSWPTIPMVVGGAMSLCGVAIVMRGRAPRRSQPDTEAKVGSAVVQRPTEVIR